MNIKLNHKKLFAIFQTMLLVSLFSIGGMAVACENQSSKSVLDVIIERGEIKVGTTADYKPFSYIDKTSELGVSGLDIDLAKNLAESLGVKLKIVNTSWPTLIEDMTSKKYDIAMSGITIKLDRQRVGLFSNPVMSSGKAAITRNENVGKYKSIASINTKGTKVIVNPGGTNEAFARANFPIATIVLNKDNLTVFDRIRDGDVDLMVTDSIETTIQAKIYPELSAVNPDDPFNYFEFGFYMGRDHTLKAYVDQWLGKLQQEGKYQMMLDRVIDEVVAKHTAQPTMSKP